MKILTTLVWIIFLSFCLTGETKILNSSQTNQVPVIIYSSTPDMQLSELNTRIKISRCELLLLENQASINAANKTQPIDTLNHLSIK